MGKPVLILLVCGGRKFVNYDMLHNAIIKLPCPNIIIQGGCDGADNLAKIWAHKNGVHCAQVDALWPIYKKKAGPIRNSAMLLLKPNYCLAMPGNNGTRDMVRKCLEINIPVWKPYDNDLCNRV